MPKAITASAEAIRMAKTTNTQPLTRPNNTGTPTPTFRTYPEDEVYLINDLNYRTFWLRFEAEQSTCWGYLSILPHAVDNVDNFKFQPLALLVETIRRKSLNRCTRIAESG